MSTDSGNTGNPGITAATQRFAELRIEGYDDVTEIGRGGFAVVYRARRVAFSQDVAIKVLNGAAVDDNATARFERERQVLGALAQHPNIVTVYDSGTAADGSPYLVMEFLPGGPLSDKLKRQGPTDVRQMADFAVKLCGALETAHRTGVLHRDIKPDNILISRYGEPVLADFGIARIAGGLQTRSGVVTATLAHAPPEVLDGHTPLPQSDVYSLGSTLFALLTGHAPFIREGDTSVTPLIARVVSAPVPDLRPRGIPADICELLERSMAKDPAERPASALEFGQAFQRLQQMNGAVVSPLVVEQLPDDIAFQAGGPPTLAQTGPGRTGTTQRQFPTGPTPHGGPHGTGPQSGRSNTGPSYPAGVGPYQGPGQTGPRAAGAGTAGRPRWLWPAVGAAAAAVAIVVVSLVVANAGGGGSPITPPTSNTALPGGTGGTNPFDGDPGPTSAVPVPPVGTGGTGGGTADGPVDEESLKQMLLAYTDLGVGGGTVDVSLDYSISSLLGCNRPVAAADKVAEAKRIIAPPNQNPDGSENRYQVHTYVAAFTDAGKAGEFMTSLEQTGKSCIDGGALLDRAGVIAAPPGGERAYQAIASKRDVIWVQYQNYVTKTEISFSTGAAVDRTTSPDIATRAIQKVIQGAAS